MAGHKYLPNGKIQIVITHGSDLRGKPKRYYKTIDHCSKKQLEIEDALFLAEVMNRSTTAGSSTTVTMLWNDFLANHCRDLKISTVGRYKTLYSNQIKPYFADRKIKSISRVDIRDWVSDLLDTDHPQFGDRTLSPRTVKNALGLLRQLFNYAIDELELIEKNPCQRIKVRQKSIAADDSRIININGPRHKTAHKKLYTEAECLDLIRILMKDRMKDYSGMRNGTLLLLILFTGLRTSEVMGLKWSDIDLNKNILRVERERIFVPNEGIFMDSVKSTSSERVISMPVFLTDLLCELKQEQEKHKKLMGNDYLSSGYVAVMENGRPQSPRSTYTWFKRFQDRHGFRSCSIHDLRHTHAAMLSRLGVEIIDVSQRLGHANTRITQEVYEYLFQNIDDKISVQLDEYFHKKANL